MIGKGRSETRIAELEDEVRRLWRKLELGPAAPLLRHPQGDGSAYVDVRDGAYEIAVEERGQEYWRDRGLSLDEAARFFLFEMAVAQAGRDEVAARAAVRGYSRWNWMAPAIALMGRMAPRYGQWAAEHYAAVLERAPLTEEEIRFSRWPFP